MVDESWLARLGVRMNLRVFRMALITAICVISVPKLADAKVDKETAAQLAMTPEDVANRTMIKDDQLEPEITFSTQAVFVSKRLSSPHYDDFIRAFVRKSDGRTDAQVYVTVEYTGAWALFGQASYLGSNGLKTIAIAKLGTDVDCGSYSCWHTEDVAIPLSISELRWLASQYRPGEYNPATFRLRGLGGMDIDVQLMPAEAAGIVAKIDQYRTDWKLPPDPAEKTAN